MEMGKLDEAVLLKRMPQMCCMPNFLPYSIVICGLCKVKGRMQEVEELVCEMLQNGHNLDTTLYCITACLVDIVIMGMKKWH